MKKTIDPSKAFMLGIIVGFYSSAIIISNPVQTGHEEQVETPPQVLAYEEHVELESYVEPAQVELIEPVHQALEQIPHESPRTSDIIRYIYQQAEDRGIDPDAVAHTIYCECMFYNIQSGIVKDGVREESYGLAQIHLPSHPNVTKAQALNPYFAVDFILNNWENDIWHGYDRATDTCANDIAPYW